MFPFQVLATLAGSDQELLQWHLNRQPSKALSLCIEALAYCAGALTGTCPLCGATLTDTQMPALLTIFLFLSTAFSANLFTDVSMQITATASIKGTPTRTARRTFWALTRRMTRRASTTACLACAR